MTVNGSSLQVLIVGAGIGGLTAAVALRRQGHRVLMFEKSRFASEIGAAIHAAPNSSRLLRRLGMEPKEHGGTLMKGMAFYDGKGNLKSTSTTEGMRGNENQDWYLIHRAHLHQALKDLALSEKGAGRPAELRLNCKIVDLDIEVKTIVLETGEIFSGDLIIVSKLTKQSFTRSYVAPDARTFPSGKSCYRWLAPEEYFLSHEATKEYASRPGYMYEWLNGDRRLYYYPCANHTISNLVAFLPSVEAESSDTSGWSAQACKEALLGSFSAFGPGPREVLKQAPEAEIKVWSLEDMESLATWFKGPLVLIGDAAHPFMPYSGQGGAMAIEDGAALGAVLPIGTKASEIPARLALWQKCRQNRVEHIRAFT
ncbi:FAD binding domain protein [Seiridium cupressi]